MTTIINNPPSAPENNGNAASGGSGVVIGAVLVVLIVAVIVFLSLPYLRSRIDSMSKPTVNNPTINVQLPNLPTVTSTPAQ